MDITCIEAIISIAASVLSIYKASQADNYAKQANDYAKQAKQYKEKALRLSDILGLQGIFATFVSESKVFEERTRSDQWNKGLADARGSVIKPYRDTLPKIREVYHLMKDHKELKSKVDSLDDIVDEYEKANPQKKKEVRTLIREITEILHQELISNRKKVI